MLARVLQVADIYDALTTARPYKAAFSHREAVDVMMEEVHRGWRDPELVPLFAEVTQSTGAGAWFAEVSAETEGDLSVQQSLANMGRELAK